MGRFVQDPLVVVSVWPVVVVPVTVGGAVFDGPNRLGDPEVEESEDSGVPPTYAEAGHVAKVWCVFQFEGSALSDVSADFALRQVLLETSRKYRVPLCPSRVTQYLFPKRTDVEAMVTVFQAPLVSERLVPYTSSVPG